MLRLVSSKMMLSVVPNGGFGYRPNLAQLPEPWKLIKPNVGDISLLRCLSSKVMGGGAVSHGYNKPLLVPNWEPWKMIMPNKGQIRNYDPLSDWKDLIGHEYVTLLTEKNIDSYLKGQESVLVMFYAPWCHHCKGAKPEFAKAAYALTTEMKSAKLAAIDCILYPDVYEKYEVTGYPTFKYYRNGSLIGEYHHRRRAMDFVHFMLRTPKTKDDM